MIPGRANPRATWVLGLAFFGPGTGTFALPETPVIPIGIQTHSDGRTPIGELFEAYYRLLERGWQLDHVASSQPPGTDHALPIIALRTPQSGPSVWILAGIHGEEPAGPNAIAAAIDEIAALGEHHSVVLLPMCNPQGYARNWRYLNTPVYSDTIDGQSVGDSSHLLQDSRGNRPRATAASSLEADALTRYVIDRSRDYPPRYSIDLHEDNLISEGYVYSQGERGASDPLAFEAVRILEENAIPIKMNGHTRFQEQISAGIVGPVVDSSIDELISAARVIVDGDSVAGPNAPTVLVFETPAGALNLERRTAAHAALIRRLAVRIAEAPD